MNKQTSPIKKLGQIVFGLGILSFLLAWISNNFENFEGWQSFFLIGFISSLLIYFAFSLFTKNNLPKWIIKIVLIAIFIRIGFGVASFYALPIWGNPTCNQQLELIIDDCPEPNGYLTRDAYKRDFAAWELANSELSLFESFHDFSTFDQYGGLLFLNSFIYRFLSFNHHFPLLIILIGGTISGLGVLFTWGFAQQFATQNISKYSALIVAFYPDAVFFGSSQMREAFTITLFMLGFYLLIKNGSKSIKKSITPIVIISLLLLMFSIPTGILFISILFFLSRYFDIVSIFKNKNFEKYLTFFIIAILFSGWILRDNIPALRDALHLQSYYSWKSSGLLQKIFKIFPEWVRIPFLMIYGVARPLLPATIIAKGNIIWKSIAIMRATGWTILLIFLFYGTYLLIKDKLASNKYKILIILNWIIIFIASFRGGGDDWDNPRYRLILIGFQAVVAAWAFEKQKESKDPILKRFVLFIGGLVFWIIVWYFPRYVATSLIISGSLFNSIILGAVFGLLLIIQTIFKLPKTK